MLISTTAFKNKIILAILAGMMLGCGGASRTASTREAMASLEELVSQRDFEVISDLAMPLATNAMNSISNAGLFPPGSSVAQINLIGNPNYVRVMGDSVSVYLPYFGERQIGGGYNNDGPGIQFDGIPEKVEIFKNEDKNRYDIQFRMKNKSEMFNVNVSLFPNLVSTINVNSTQRFPIRYNGQVRRIPIKE